LHNQPSWTKSKLLFLLQYIIHKLIKNKFSSYRPFFSHVSFFSSHIKTNMWHGLKMKTQMKGPKFTHNKRTISSQKDTSLLSLSTNNKWMNVQSISTIFLHFYFEKS
jgi:hypothetical protein